MKSILECSTKGDIRFSAFGARVKVFGVENTIESHYQQAKVVITGRDVYGEPIAYVAGKGKRPSAMRLMKRAGIYTYLDVKYITPFYKLLWVKYLDEHPELVEYASQFDDFHDMFKGKSINCQADVIREYIKLGRNHIMNDPLVIEFKQILRG